MKKLISNKARERIIAKHTPEEIANGILTLKRVYGHEIEALLRQKLLEEVNEYLAGEGDDELDDIIDVCLALRNFADSKYSEGYVITDTYPPKK